LPFLIELGFQTKTKKKERHDAQQLELSGQKGLIMAALLGLGPINLLKIPNALGENIF